MTERFRTIYSSLEPTSPELRYHYLFDIPDYELFEGSDNYDEQRVRIVKHRDEALRCIYKGDGFEAIWRFSESVSKPYEVGLALGTSLGVDVEMELLPAGLIKTNAI